MQNTEVSRSVDSDRVEKHEALKSRNVGGWISRRAWKGVDGEWAGKFSV